MTAGSPPKARETLRKVCGLALHHALRPIRQGDPVLPFKEEGLHQHGAPEFQCATGAGRSPPDPLVELFETRRTVLRPERLPRHGQRQRREVHEIAPACDVVVRRLQFEEKGCARRQVGEWRSSAGLPEIHLIVVPFRKELVPVVVGDPGPELHAAVKL